MNVLQLFNRAVTIGKTNDPRGEEEVQRCLKAREKAWQALDSTEQNLTDMETLRHPYDDSRVFHCADEKDIGEMIVAINITREHLNTARLLGIGTCWSHHPRGVETGIPVVMEIQHAIFRRAGVPDGVIDKLMPERVKEVARKFLPIDMEDPIAAARHLDINLLATHTPADNCVQTFLEKAFLRAEAQAKLRTLGDLLNFLLQFPEYQHAFRTGQGCKLIAGERSNRVGKVMVKMTGGTEGPIGIYQPLANAGISTVVGMHFSDEHMKAAKEAGINLVIAGHISSDSIGMNLLMDKIEELTGEEFQIAPGFLRIRRHGEDDLSGTEISH